MWGFVKDFKSKDSKFCFSDGCGMISLDLWKEMCNDLEIDGMPCAFQVRPFFKDTVHSILSFDSSVSKGC